MILDKVLGSASSRAHHNKRALLLSTLLTYSHSTGCNMKNMILLSLVLCATLMSGCQRSSDDAKIDALTQKIDGLLKDQSVIRSNQVWIIKEISYVKMQVAELPTMNQINSTAYYYHTNTINAIQDHIDTQAHVLLGMSDLLVNQNSLILTNIFAMESLGPVPNQSSAGESLADTARRLLTADDISQINLKMDSMQDDLRKIKIGLGIPY